MGGDPMKTHSDRGVGGKRCNRRSISMTNLTNTRAKKLAVSCDMPVAKFLAMLIEDMLNNQSVVEHYQDKYNKNPQYRVKPIVISQNGKQFLDY